MGFKNVRQLAQSIDDDGQSWLSWVTKTTGPTSTAGRWMDLSMGAGIPKFNAYGGAPLTATPFVGAGNDGIYCGPTPPAGQTKHLTNFFIQSTSTTLVPAYFLLCDYLLQYPFIDGDESAEQVMDNTEVLPRGDGKGVECMVVCTAPMAATANVTVKYTNQDGVSNRTSNFSLIAASAVGVLANAGNNLLSAGAASPFIPMQGSDYGIRSIDSVTFNAATGGFMSFVLMKRVAQIQLRELGVACEMDQFTQRGGVLPKIENGAYLNMIYNTAVAGTAVPLRAALEFTWR